MKETTHPTENKVESNESGSAMLKVLGAITLSGATLFGGDEYLQSHAISKHDSSRRGEKDKEVLVETIQTADGKVFVTEVSVEKGALSKPNGLGSGYNWKDAHTSNLAKDGSGTRINYTVTLDGKLEMTIITLGPGNQVLDKKVVYLTDKK